MTPQTPITIEKIDRYSRLRSIDWWQQDILRHAHVLVAGAGALGNEVLKNLALIGVGHILIVDFDKVDITNLSRSVLFRLGDEEQPKAALAAQRVREINPDVQVEAVQGDVVWDIGLGILSQMDVVIGCLDNREARLGLNRNCWKMNVPWIDGALSVLAGQVRIFSPPSSACYECGMSAQDYRDMNLRYSCQLLAEDGLLEGRASTTPISASIIAAIQVQELLKILHGQPFLAGCELEYDGQFHHYRTTQLKRREDCFSHDNIPNQEVTHLFNAQAKNFTVGAMLQKIQLDLGEKAYLLLDREIITDLICPNRHPPEYRVYPRHRAGTKVITCPQCGVERSLQFTHRITNNSLNDLSLADLGVPAGHILIGCYGNQQRYYQLSGDELFGQALFDGKTEDSK